MKKYCCLGILTLFLLFSGLAHGAMLEDMDLPIDQAKLTAGELQVFIHQYKVEGKGVKKRVVGVQVIDAPVSTVWSVLADWESMASYVPTLDFYKTVHNVRPKDANGVYENLLNGQIKIMFFKIPYSLGVIYDEKKMRQEWRLIDKKEAEGLRQKGVKVVDPYWGVKSVSGFEYIKPFGDGSKTLYVYAPIIESTVPVPESWERYASKKSLLGYMAGIKKRAESMKKP